MPKIEKYAQGTPSYVELVTPDQAAAKAFYGPLFGWELEDVGLDENGYYVTVAKEGDSVAGLSGQLPGMEGHPAFWGVYLTVDVAWDTEANKSVGLKDKLLREARSPRCDVHWNNEILGTLDLQKHGVLAPYASPSATPYPAEFKAADHTWTAFAARARVLLVNTDKVKKDDFPKSLMDLTDARFKNKIAMAKPLFGTTATQAQRRFGFAASIWKRTRASYPMRMAARSLTTTAAASRY